MRSVIGAIVVWSGMLTSPTSADEADPTTVQQGAQANTFLSLGGFSTGRRTLYAMCRPVWLDHMGCALMWPQCYKREADYFLYEPGGRPQVLPRKGTFKDDMYINRLLISPLACCYLPGAKRVLFFQPRARFKPEKDPTTWLLDPTSGVWEAVAFRTQMSPRDAAHFCSAPPPSSQ